MRKPLIHILAMAAALIVVVPGAASAAECWEVCNPTVSCDTECGWDEGKGGPVTCGEQGLPCDEGGGVWMAAAWPAWMTSEGGHQVDDLSLEAGDLPGGSEPKTLDVNEGPIPGANRLP